jgi:SAM-dependent methyltransferase
MGAAQSSLNSSEAEEIRAKDLMRLVPKNRRSVLDIGARGGVFSRLLTQYFDTVVALDLVKPPFSIPGVETVAGDVTRLQFADNEFDCIFCAEVLEHVPDLQRAAREITRVVAHEALIGVPYRQDTRVGRTTCGACSRISPPWGHVNQFDEPKLRDLFSGLRVIETSLVGTNREHTNALATKLMDLAGNPWGTYDQQEHCIYCDAKLVRPQNLSLSAKLLAKASLALTSLQTTITRPHGNWIHILFTKDAR